MKILQIISGSVAANKAAELAGELTKQGHSVTVILTKAAENFVTAEQVSALTGNKTHTNLWAKDEDSMLHISLSREADLVLVAPASADIIAKIANGFADDMATATILASDKKLYIAPAMNVEMWNKPATKRNVKQVEKDGATVISPEKGKLACGEFGEGRMAEVQNIIKALPL